MFSYLGKGDILRVKPQQLEQFYFFLYVLNSPTKVEIEYLKIMNNNKWQILYNN